MAISKGKKFEKIVQEALAEWSPIRLYDTMNGFRGVANPCDFIAYNFPCMYHLECKSTYDGTLNFSSISETQYEAATSRDEIKGIVAGFIVWFISLNQIVYIPGKTIKALKEKGYKSISIKALEKEKLHYCVISHQTTKVYPKIFKREFQQTLIDAGEWYG